MPLAPLADLLSDRLGQFVLEYWLDCCFLAAIMYVIWWAVQTGELIYLAIAGLKFCFAREIDAW